MLQGGLKECTQLRAPGRCRGNASSDDNDTVADAVTLPMAGSLSAPSKTAAPLSPFSSGPSSCQVWSLTDSQFSKEGPLLFLEVLTRNNLTSQLQEMLYTGQPNPCADTFDGCSPSLCTNIFFCRYL